MKILIVDDNKDNVELIRQILINEHRLLLAFSGQQCLDIALSEQPDLIVLDVNMPEMDGYQTMQKLQSNITTQKIPVIFASAYYTESSMIVRGLEQGAFDYLTKPISEDILLAKVKVVERLKLADDDIRQKKDALEAANKKLESAGQLKSIFLASMSHELRTPLNSILGFTGLMLMEVAGAINEKQKEQLARVKSNANHLLSLINDVLDISKIEAGKYELTLESFDIVHLVNEQVEAFIPEFVEKGLDFEIQLPNMPVLIKSDQRQVKQIVMNFLSNAFKFTDEGCITVSINQHDSEQLSISVKDTGTGIKKSDISRLFQPFQQTSANLTHNYKGTGLGLYLSDKLAVAIGADIKVTSKYGEGSEFVLTLPLVINKPIEPENFLEQIDVIIKE